MSSFLVEDKTLNIIVTYIKEYKKYTEEETGKLFDKLVEMNLDAINYRYGKQYKRKDLKYSFEEVKESPIQVYKCMCCLLYQCSEGEIEKSVIFKFVKKIKKDLAESITLGLEEYDEAYWG